MSQENPISKQPLIRYMNRQQMSWRAVDVEQLIGEDHPARAIWVLVAENEVCSRTVLFGSCGTEPDATRSLPEIEIFRIGPDSDLRWKKKARYSPAGNHFSPEILNNERVFRQPPLFSTVIGSA
jgi:hypothetical protein